MGTDINDIIDIFDPQMEERISIDLRRRVHAFVALVFELSANV